MPLGRLVYWISASGSGVNAIFFVASLHCAGSLVPWRAASARPALSSARQRLRAQAVTLPLPQ